MIRAFQPASGAEWRFYATCRGNGEARVAAHREFWTVDEWAVWASHARDAFGPGDHALFGQIALVEALLNSDCTAQQIHVEFSARKAKVDAEEREQRERQRLRDQEVKETGRRAAIADEREKAIIRETARLEARDHVGSTEAQKMRSRR